MYRALPLLFLVLVSAGRPGVVIRDMQFSPASINVQVGDTVTWTNQDDRDHTVTGADGSFNSGNLRHGATFSHQFNQSGKYVYTCSYHPRMKGVVNVGGQ